MAHKSTAHFVVTRIHWGKVSQKGKSGVSLPRHDSPHRTQEHTQHMSEHHDVQDSTDLPSLKQATTMTQVDPQLCTRPKTTVVQEDSSLTTCLVDRQPSQKKLRRCTS